MSFRKLLLAGAALATTAATAAVPAQASIIDRPHFKVLGVVIVWAAEDTVAGTTPIATEFIIGDGSDTDLIAEDGRTVVTGSLTATPDAAGVAAAGYSALSRNATSLDTNAVAGMDAGDSFSAFDVTGQSITGDALVYNSSFFVASNTAFGINAEVVSSTATGDFTLADVAYDFSTQQSGTAAADGVDFGASANDLSGETFSAPADLSAFSGVTQIFESATRTAASAGNIMQQSVRFDAEYTLGATTGYDLSQGAGTLEAEMAYTFYVP